jgi:hypothetical protein
MFTYSITYLLTQSLTYLLTYVLTYILTYLLNFFLSVFLSFFLSFFGARVLEKLTGSQKCDFTQVINETLSPIQRRSWSDRDSCFLTGSVLFPPSDMASVKELYPLCAGQLDSLE